MQQHPCHVETFADVFAEEEHSGLDKKVNWLKSLVSRVVQKVQQQSSPSQIYSTLQGISQHIRRWLSTDMRCAGGTAPPAKPRPVWGTGCTEVCCGPIHFHSPRLAQEVCPGKAQRPRAGASVLSLTARNLCASRHCPKEPFHACAVRSRISAMSAMHTVFIKVVYAIQVLVTGSLYLVGDVLKHLSKYL